MAHRLSGLRHSPEYREPSCLLADYPSDISQKIMISEKNLYQLIANSTSDYLSVLDTDYTYLAVNKAYTEGFSLKSENIVGKKIYELLGHDRFENVIKPNLDKCMKENRTIQFEDWFELPQGRRFFSVSYTPMLSDCCNQVIVVTVHDNTRHKTLEDSLEEAVYELKEANSFKDKLFSIVSHDLKSPIGTIDNFLQLLGSEEDNEQLKALIPLMASRLETTKGMLDNLLDWASIQIKGQKIQTETFDLSSVFDETVNLFEEQISNKGLVVNNSLPTDLLLTTDKNTIRLILRNLLSNSIKFTNAGDLISIKIWEQKSKEITVLFEDSGVGMSSDKASKLFGGIVGSDRGTQGESGTGLGMMLVSDALSAHGGKIWAKSNLDEGSKFYFTLPLETSEVIEHILS